MDTYISMNQCRFDISQCEIRAKLNPYDVQLCINEEKDVKKNILSASGTEIAVVYVGTIQEAMSVNTNISDFNEFFFQAEVLDPIYNATFAGQVEWQHVIISGNNIVPGSPNAPPFWSGFFQITYKRERVTGSPSPPPGLGWVNISPGEWVRKPRVQEVFDEDTNTSYPSGSYFRHWKVLGEDPTDNGRTLGSVLDYLVSCVPVASDFFNINPPGTAPLADQVYVDAAAELSRILVYQKSDVTRPVVSNNATLAETTQGEFLLFLKNIFNVDWRIEKVLGVDTLRIEHLAYFEALAAVTLDMTASDYVRYIAKRGSYTYKNDKAPGLEKFFWMDVVGIEFEGNDIKYGGGCTNPDDKLEYRTQVTTDFPYSQAYPAKVSDFGFFLIATQEYSGQNVIIEGAIPGHFGTYLNAPLAYKNLHLKYWKHGRFAISGTMNEAATTFISTIPQKQQEKINAKLCLSEFEGWDFGRIRTQFGDGYSPTAKYSLRDETIELNVIF
jgi:hypothetical protein